MLINELQSYYRSINSAHHSKMYIRNLLKEQLHFYLLDFIYKHDIYRELIFYGGTCLRHCFALPRLSEDLDFEWHDTKFPFEALANDIKDYFKTVHSYTDLVIKLQKFRLYFKFPLLSKLGIADSAESDFLHVKIEINCEKHPAKSYGTELQPLFLMQRTFLVKRYDVSTLMASKINALINRSRERKSVAAGYDADVKGRDYFDLIWYMQKRIEPRLQFTQFKSSRDLWMAVSKKTALAKVKSLQNDLQNFLERPSDALDFARSFHTVYKTLLKHYQSE